MSLSIATEAVPLRTDHDGVMLVGKTRVTLDSVVSAFLDGATAEEIAQQYPSLELADIYSVIGYYLRHRPEIDAYLQRRRELAADVLRQNESRNDPSGVRDRLLARRAMSRGFTRVVIAGLTLGLGLIAIRALAEPDRPPAPNSPDEPLAAAPSLARAAAFLDGVALDWTRERKCGTCHTNYAYLIARPAVREVESPAMREIRAFFENRVAHWDDAEKSARPRWDAEVVATASALALNDAATTGTLHPMTRRALDRIWTLQRPDGAWNWLKCGWPPYEHDDYYGAVFAALGVGNAPDGYARTEAARRGLDRLRAYFRATPAPDLHHRTMRLWASLKLDGLMEPAERAETIRELRALQRPDGGWNLPSLGEWTRRDGSPNEKDVPGDGYATGFVVYVLRQADVPAEDEAIRRGVAWLKAHQRASGRWFTRSLNNDKHHYIANAGTGFAVLALKACGASDDRGPAPGSFGGLHPGPE